MPWVPKLAEAQTARAFHHCEHNAISCEIRPVIAPRHDNFPSATNEPAKPLIVAKTDRITRAKQHARRRRSEREEIRDRELTESPGARELNASTHRSIIDAMICRRWIQPDEQYGWLRRIPHST